MNNTTINSELFTALLAQSQYALYENSVARAVATVFDYPVGAGKSVSVPVWAGMTASKPGDGVAATAGDTNTSSKTINLAELVVYNQVSDFLRDSAAEDIIGTMATQAGLALAEGLDAELIALFASVTQSIGAAGSDNTAADLMKAAAMIRANKYAGPLFALVNPKQAYGIKAALTATTAYTANTVAGNAALSGGYVGSIAGITIIEHAGVTIDGDADATGCVFAPAAFGVAQRGAVAMETQRMAATRSTDVVMTLTAGAGILRPELAVKLIGDATL